MGKVISALTWCRQLAAAPVKARKKARKLALDAIGHFKKGKASEEGKTLVESLEKDFTFVGFCPSVSYIKETGSKDDLRAQWVHPFSTPSLLYKHKKLPVLIIANGNLDFNDSRLRKIDKNMGLDELHDILGITG